MNKNLLIPLLISLFVSGCAARPPLQTLPQPVPPSGRFHTVEKGQTLWRIARNYGVDLGDLMSVNGITDPRKVETGRRLVIPSDHVAPAQKATAPDDGEAKVERLVRQHSGQLKWRTITLHHSATRYGNGKVFDREHRKRGMGGLFYHFLIGNGNGLGDGEIEAGWRWKRQKEVNRPADIQICVIGNFTKQRVSERQYRALRQLVTVLRRRYRIEPLWRVRRHCDIAKKRPTECPGGNFPFKRLIEDLRKTE